MHKDVIINEHERSDIIEDCNNVLKKMEKLKPYIVEFEEDSAMKAKTYSSKMRSRRTELTPNCGYSS